MSPFSSLFRLPQPSLASVNFRKKKKEKKKGKNEEKNLHKIERIMVCLLCYQW